MCKLYVMYIVQWGSCRVWFISTIMKAEVVVKAGWNCLLVVVDQLLTFHIFC